MFITYNKNKVNGASIIMFTQQALKSDDFQKKFKLECLQAMLEKVRCLRH